MSRKGRDEVSKFEWLTGALGALIFVFLIGHFAREAGRSRTPPSIEVRIDSVTRSPAGVAAHFSARNGGGVSATEVHLEASAEAPGGAVTSRATIPFLAAGSSQSGAFLFDRDPGPGLRARAVSYQSP